MTDLIFSNNEQEVRELIDQGVDLTIQDCNGETALMLAIKNILYQKDSCIASLLLKAGTHVNIQDKRGYTALIYAIEGMCYSVLEGWKEKEHCYEEIQKQLYEAGAKSPYDLGFYAIAACEAIHKKDYQTLQVMISLCPKNKDLILFELFDIVEYVIFEDNAELLLMLIQAGHVYINSPRRSYLATACRRKAYECIKVLIQFGANVELSKYGKIETPLLIAIEKDFCEGVKILLDAGACVNDKDSWGKTTLHEACRTGNYEIIALLIKFGADVNAISFGKSTPLIIAVEKNDYNLVKLLIDFGADVTIRGKDNYLPVMHAIEKEYKEIEELLLQTGKYKKYY